MCFTKDMQVRGGKEADIVNFPGKKNPKKSLGLE